MPTKNDKPAEDNRPSQIDEVRELYDLMVAEGLDVLELKNGNQRIQLTRQFAPVVVHGHAAAPMRAHERPAGAKSAKPTAPAATPKGESIDAPLAGVFYRASGPTSAPFAKEGDVVIPGQTLCIVEAMKVMNEIKADKNCRIVKIAAENSRPVTVGQPLFWIEPA